MDPGENLVLVMQIRNVNSVLARAVVVVRSSVSAVSPSNCIPAVQVFHERVFVNCTCHTAVSCKMSDFV